MSKKMSKPSISEAKDIFDLIGEFKPVVYDMPFILYISRFNRILKSIKKAERKKMEILIDKIVNPEVEESGILLISKPDISDVSDENDSEPKLLINSHEPESCLPNSFRRECGVCTYVKIGTPAFESAIKEFFIRLWPCSSSYGVFGPYMFYRAYVSNHISLKNNKSTDGMVELFQHLSFTPVIQFGDSVVFCVSDDQCAVYKQLVQPLQFN